MCLTVLGVIISKDDMVVGGMEIYIYIYICKIVSIETKVIWFRWLSSFVFYLKSELRVAGDKNQSMCVYIYIYMFWICGFFVWVNNEEIISFF